MSERGASLYVVASGEGRGRREGRGRKGKEGEGAGTKEQDDGFFPLLSVNLSPTQNARRLSLPLFPSLASKRKEGRKEDGGTRRERERRREREETREAHCCVGTKTCLSLPPSALTFDKKEEARRAHLLHESAPLSLSLSLCRGLAIYTQQTLARSRSALWTGVRTQEYAAECEVIF